jgi:hypothetical protein
MPLTNHRCYLIGITLMIQSRGSIHGAFWIHFKERFIISKHTLLTFFHLTRTNILTFEKAKTQKYNGNTNCHTFSSHSISFVQSMNWHNMSRWISNSKQRIQKATERNVSKHQKFSEIHSSHHFSSSEGCSKNNINHYHRRSTVEGETRILK